jgi:probable HAF family extracellular repeat protein
VGVSDTAEVGTGGWERHAVLWENDAIIDLGLGHDSEAFDINELGQVVGYHKIDGVCRPFLWKDGDVTYLDELDPRWWIIDARGINDAGQIVGHGNFDFDDDGIFEEAGAFVLTPIPPVPPVANFIALPRSGLAPLEVKFIDESTGATDTWLWDFGDGNTSEERNPVHIYEHWDVYTVNLTVSGPAGDDTMIKADYITAISPDAADLKGRCKEFHSYRFGKEIEITIQVKNKGNEKADSFKVAFYLSKNRKTLGDLLEEIPVETGLDEGKCQKISLDYSSEKSLSRKYILAVVDSADEVVETDETNNRVSMRIP